MIILTARFHVILNMLNRQMYGRANFDLHRKMRHPRQIVKCTIRIRKLRQIQFCSAIDSDCGP